jgi:hypothetical protein
MRSNLFIILAVLMFGATPGLAQSSADSTAIRQAALDYIEGWYEGDATRMASALHPGLVKRIVHTDSLGDAFLSQEDASQLITATGAGGGREAERRRADVAILDVFGDVANVRVDAGDWIDYLQLVRFRGRWLILHVLGTFRPEAR